MTTVIVPQNNAVQVIASNENITDSYNTVNELINNNDKNVVNGTEETPCDNVICNKTTDNSLETNFKDINSDMDTDASLTEKHSDNNPKNIQPDIMDDASNKLASGLKETVESNDIDEPMDTSSNLLKSDDEDEVIKLPSKRYCNIVDSDSEDEDIINSRSKENAVEDDNESVTSNESLTTNNVIQNKSNRKLLDSDSESESEHPEENKNVAKKTVSRLETLVDAESDEDEIQKTESYVEQDDEHISSHKIYKKMTKSEDCRKENNRKGSIRDSKTEAMKQIHSETQRLIRESEISLPYHRPKLRTLQEFLNRKQISVTLPEASTTASKLKMSSIIVSKLLKDKEKEAEEFYKSSDSEDEEDKAEQNSNARDIGNKTPFRDMECDLNENTQKLINSDICSNEVSEHESSLNNVSRRLFNENTNDETKDMNNLQCLLTSNDKTENVQDHHGTNDEIDVQKTVDMLLQSVENEIKTSSEVHLEKRACEIPETMDVDSSMNEDDNMSLDTSSMEEKSMSEEQKLQCDTTDCHKNVDVPASEEKLEETESHVQGLPLPDFIDQENNSNKKRLLPIIKSNTEQPRLRGNPGMMIDLSCDVKSNKAGVQSLLDRFFSKHTATDRDVEKTTEISVVHVEQTTDGPKMVQHAVIHKQLALEKEDPELNKPGAKLQRLKEDLKFKMAMKRNEEWKQKEQELIEEEDELKEDDVYDICNEEKLDDENSESGESEPEEDDVLMVDKRKRRTCEFADEEAEESEDEKEARDEEEEEQDEDEEEDEEKDSEMEINEDDNDEDSNDSDIVNKKWKPKRILRAFEDDSNSSSSNILLNEANKLKKKAFERSSTDVDMFETNNDNCQTDWNSDKESNISAFQKHKQSDAMLQLCKTPSIKTNCFDFVSPITQLTILHTNSDTKRKDSTKKDQFSFVDSFSPLHTPFGKTLSSHNPDKRIGFQKKLFDDCNSVTKDEELLQLCSGTFPPTQATNLNAMLSTQTSSQDVFNSQTLCTNTSDNYLSLEKENSQDMKLFFEENSGSPTDDKAKSKGKLDTDAPWTKLNVVRSSDDEDDDEDSGNKNNKIKLKRKRHVKMLEISDDEDENDDKLQSDEEEEEEEEEDEEEEELVDYDSEENEVPVTKKNIKKATSEFFEKEAELSESDWDSADEDEKDLDKLEVEEGDEDDIDEDKVRNQLEKIHMRQILDQDQREVRMLQELLFEDGDLHSDGSGRQRKFKWKNIDKLGENNETPRIEDDTNAGLDVQENESELEWCKLRHEREKFLEEKKREVDIEIEEDLEKSKIFKFGVKVFKRIESVQSDKQDTPGNDIKPIEPIMPRNLTDLLNTSILKGKRSTLNNVMKRHGFLSRGEQELERIAKRVKLNDKVNLAPVNSKNFVFAHTSPVVKFEDDEENENIHEEEENESKDKTSRHGKRKATTGTTLKTNKRAKKEGTDTNKKKLFGYI